MILFEFVSAEWVEEHLDAPDVLVLDPRSPVRYMAGHPKNAVNAPVMKARDAQGKLLPPEELGRWLGAAGLDERHTPVIYDNADGRNAAFLAWILMYLGRTDVRVMETLWEQWVASGLEAFYRPVRATPREFYARVRPEFRSNLEDVPAPGARLVDMRAAEEFSGELDTEGRPGHIPGAVHLSWQELSNNGRMLAPREKLEKIFADRGFGADEHVIAYCRTGVRAALGFLALTQLGRKVSLYDGSYAEWAKSGLPVESAIANEEKGESNHA
jgi:thiosulfate/3-mercaptopyruvate sulfurtransferase